MDYAKRLKYLYPTAVYADFSLVQDKFGTTTLEYFNEAKLGVAPTLSYLETLDINLVNAELIDRAKEKEYDKKIIKAVAKTLVVYINELRAIESLPTLTLNKVRNDIKSNL